MTPTPHPHLQQLFLMHALLSRVNRSIVRAESPDDLFQEICRCAVDSSLFDLAWIGLVSPQGKLLPLTSQGDTEGLVDQLAVADQAPSAPAALRSVVNGGASFAYNHPNQAIPWLEDIVMAEPRLTGMARFALKEGENIIAILELYSKKTGLFSSDILVLMEEVVSDISYALNHLKGEEHRRVAESKVYYLAYYSAQTGLPSRALLEQRLLQLATEGVKALALLHIKLLKLETILHVLGQSAVDELLRSIAHRLGEFKDTTLLAHLSQDEFVLVLPATEDIQKKVQQVRDRLGEVTLIAGYEFFLNSSVGVCLFPFDEADISQLLRRAQVASQNLGSDGGILFYRTEFDRNLATRLVLESELHRALERGEFILHYQPQVNLKTGVIVGAEALLRWQHPVRGLLPPIQFVPLLEESGLIVPVGKWVLHTACAQNQAWQDEGLAPIRIAVNLSGQQFLLSELVETVQESLAASRLDPQWLELELTEGIILADAERTIATMHQLKQLGVSLSLDDFGTGYSSLSYLLRFPIDRIKIDRSFVQNVATNTSSGILARTILTMTHNLRKTSIAEGIEDAEQLGYLRKHACQEMQGFFFSQPLPAEDLAQCLREGRQLPLPPGVSNAHNTVLVVDDEPNVLHALRRALRRSGLTVLTAEDAISALAILATEEVGLIICDQRIPGMSGTELLSNVKDLYPDIIRILLTGYTELNAVIGAVNQGTLYKLLTKPWDDEQLRENVREGLQRFETVQENRRLLQRLDQLA